MCIRDRLELVLVPAIVLVVVFVLLLVLVFVLCALCWCACEGFELGWWVVHMLVVQAWQELQGSFFIEEVRSKNACHQKMSHIYG